MLSHNGVRTTTPRLSKN